MKAARKIGALVLVVLALGLIALAQDGGGSGDPNMAAEQKAPTVMGGTGLFNTFSTRTLCKGEFNFAVFWNNFEADPGDISINQVPVNITFGLTNRWEIWADWNTWQQATSRNPFLLSGYQLSAVRFFGDPFTILGPPSGGTGGSAAFFPGSGSLVGGILPPPGHFGTPLGFGTSVFSPGGELVEFHAAPEGYCTNICFGGPDMRTAYITLSGYGQLFEARWPRPGLHLSARRV